MKYITIIFLSLSFTLFAHAETEPLAQTLALYQPEEKIMSLESEVIFWQKKAAAAPNQLTFKTQLAGAHTALFGATASIADLKKAESLLRNVLRAQPTPSANTLRALAHNYISQHRFCEAMEMVTAAIEIGSDRRASELMLFDLYEELGDQEAQENLLRKLSAQKDFNYLIRLAKYEDGQGRLDRTIALMKQAEAIAESSQQLGRKIWIYTNLADYYGHAGELLLSKKYFKKALALNSADWYSMKGLAYIVYSNEEESDKALAILNRIEKHSADPGIKLLEAEIRSYTGSQTSKAVIEKEVAAEVNTADFGNMYHAFLCDYYLSEKEFDKALAIADKEIRLRATPQSYDLKAQVLFAKGDIKGARQISKQQIWNHTFEPHILKNQLTYFKGMELPYVNEITKELQDARFELGPLTCQELFGEV